MLPVPLKHMQRGWLQVLMLILVIMVLAVFSGSCSRKPENPGKELPAKKTRPLLYDKELGQKIIYFLTSDERYLVPITVTFNPTREAAKVAVEKLIAGPQREDLKPVMPDGVKLKDLYIINSNQTIYVDLTKHIFNLKETEQVEKSIKALVLTLTETDGTQNVQVLVEGEIVPEISGVKVDTPFSRPDNINSLLRNDDQKGVQVYFYDESASYLIPVTVPLPYGASQEDLPRAALLALLSGPPKNSGLIRTVWPGTRLLNFSIDKGLATVDLSKEVTGYGGGSTAETSLVNSLLFTLTQFNEINRVQLLIEGEKREYLPEGTIINKPLRRPDSINFNY